MFAEKSWDEWIGQYAQSHQNSANRICHTIGIPLIAVSIKKQNDLRQNY
jgi:uncharacterized membrane protein YGL010W